MIAGSLYRSKPTNEENISEIEITAATHCAKASLLRTLARGWKDLIY
jgi:hypothetical protein